MAHFQILLLLPTIVLCLLVSPAASRSESRDVSRQCRLDQLSASLPSQSIESEGGVTELWDETEDQFQCAGVAATRNTIRPNSLSLPNYQPYPRLVYIESGRGLLGLSVPGCPETYQSGSKRPGSLPLETGTKEGRDQHQKVFEIREGEVVLIPAGATHFCVNDGDEDLVAVSVTDLRNSANQLGRKFRQFYLAGSLPEQSQRFPNLLRELNEDMLSEAFNIPVDVVMKMQKENNRGLIVKLNKDGMSMGRPGDRIDVKVAANGHQRQSQRDNSMCDAKINQNISNPKDARVYGKNAGSLTVADGRTLPILEIADLSSERLTLLDVWAHHSVCDRRRGTSAGVTHRRPGSVGRECLQRKTILGASERGIHGEGWE